MPPTTTATELSGEYAESAEGLETDQEIGDSGDSEDFVFDKYLAIKLSGDEVSDFTKNLDLLKQQLLLNKKSLIDSQEDLEKIKISIEQNLVDIGSNKKAIDSLKNKFLKTLKDELTNQIDPLNEKLLSLQNHQEQLLSEKEAIQELLTSSNEELTEIADEVLEKYNIQITDSVDKIAKVIRVLKNNLKEHDEDLEENAALITDQQKQIADLIVKIADLNIDDLPEDLRAGYEGSLRTLREEQRLINIRKYDLEKELEEAESDLKVTIGLINEQEKAIIGAGMILEYQEDYTDDDVDSSLDEEDSLLQGQQKDLELSILRITDKFEDFREYEDQTSSVILGSPYSSSRIDGFKELSAKLSAIKDKFETYCLTYQNNSQDVMDDALIFIKAEIDPLIEDLKNSALYKTAIAPRLSESVATNIYSLKNLLSIHKQVLTQLNWEINKLRDSFSSDVFSLIVDELDGDQGIAVSALPVISLYNEKNSLDILGTIKEEEITKLDPENIEFLAKSDTDRPISSQLIIAEIDDQQAEILELPVAAEALEPAAIEALEPTAIEALEPAAVEVLEEPAAVETLEPAAIEALEPVVIEELDFDTSSEEDNVELEESDADTASLYSDRFIDDLMMSDDDLSIGVAEAINEAEDQDEAEDETEADEVVEVIETSEIFTVNVDPLNTDSFRPRNLNASPAIDHVEEELSSVRNQIIAPGRATIEAEAELPETITPAEVAVELAGGVESPNENTAVLPISQAPLIEWFNKAELATSEEIIELARSAKTIAKPLITDNIKPMESFKLASGGTPPEPVSLEQGGVVLLEENLSDSATPLTESSKKDEQIKIVHRASSYDHDITHHVYDRASETNSTYKSFGFINMENLKLNNTFLSKKLTYSSLSLMLSSQTDNKSNFRELADNIQNSADNSNEENVSSLYKFKSKILDGGVTVNKLFIEFYGFIRRKFEIWS